MSIIRVVHNKENPYVQLNKKALWNENLSLKAIGLWARCMSRPDDWHFNIKELSQKCKEGRRAIDSAINELIEANYAIRIEHHEKGDGGRFSGKGYEYIFFEFPVSEEEKQKYTEEFKKSFRNCGFGNLRDGDIRNSNLLNTDITPNGVKEELKTEETKGRVAPTSADADSLTDFFLKKIQERKPDFKPKNLHKWKVEMDRLLRIDKKDPQKVRELIEWVSNDLFWRDNVLSPDTLRRQYEKLEIKKLGSSEKELIRKNRDYAVKLKEKYPEPLKGLTFDEKFVMNRVTCKEIPFNLPEETFQQALRNLFGGNDGR